MKTFHLILSLCLFAVTCLVATVHGALPAAALLFVGGHALTYAHNVPSGILSVTLTPTILLQQTVRQLFNKAPALSFFSNEFTTERLKKGQQVIGKIRKRPVAAEYDAGNGGYEAGAQDGKDLLVDVPFKMDSHLHVTIRLSHLNAISDSMNKMEEHIEDSASVIGESVSRTILGNIRSGAFANSTIFSEANSNKDMLNKIRKKMNKRSVGSPRFALVNSDVAETLSNDPRIANRYDDKSKDTDTNPYTTLTSLAGFNTIQEDPALDARVTTPVNLTAAASGDLITTAAAHNFLVGDRVKMPALTGGAGLTAGDYYFVKSVPSTTTLTVSATHGGAVVDITSDATVGTIQQAENITGFFATRSAIAIKTGLPIDSVEAAQALGIPVPVSSEVITDPTTGLSMIAYKWFKTGPMDAYITLACLYGSTAGDLVDAVGLAMGPSGEILRSE
ncbi:MAG: hypothetical protein QM496_13900 [Verrucomicrobiota bacterium]